jgi:hypothetical protein
MFYINPVFTEIFPYPENRVKTNAKLITVKWKPKRKRKKKSRLGFSGT